MNRYGYVKYWVGNVRRNGNKTWYYRFYNYYQEDLTQYFGMVGRKVKLKNGIAILSDISPQELFKRFHSDIQYTGYITQELKSIQKKVNNCTKGLDCENKCTDDYIYECSLVDEYRRCSLINKYIHEVINAPESHWTSVARK